MIKKFETEMLDASNAYQGIISISNRNSSKKEKVVYLLWTLEDIGDVLKKYDKRYRDQYNVLLKEYGDLMEANNPQTGRPIWDIPPSKREEFDEKVEELEQVKIEFTCERLMLKDIIDHLEISGGEIRPLRKIGILIKDEIDKKKKRDAESN
jgi:hypothetical protein